jgi:hypothetical protein
MEQEERKLEVIPPEQFHLDPIDGGVLCPTASGSLQPTKSGDRIVYHRPKRATSPRQASPTPETAKQEQQ